MHDPRHVHKSPKQRYLHMDLDLIVQCEWGSLLTQTNSNWLAFFFVTDPSPFDRRLARILHRYADPRLVPLDVEMKFRPVFTKIDGGYTTTDHVLRQILGKPECRWISATNGDNAYGSELVDRVINAPNLALLHSDSGGRGNIGISSNTGSGKRQADMLLVPMDSRNFADQDYILRKDLAWDRKCLGIQATLAISGMAYTASPVPKIARVDLAAIFLKRDKLLAENVWFGNFSDKNRFHCLGCNDGYFTQYLVRNRGWTYTRLPIDGLRSVMFHGPSPTHCIAAGNVWFDHPRENRVGCLAHSTVQRMLSKDLGRQYGTHPEVPYFDWVHYNASDRVCLRLSQYGYAHSDLLMRRRLEGTGGEGRMDLYPSYARSATYRPPAEQWRQVQRALQTQTHIQSYTHRRQLKEQPVEQCVWWQYLKMNPDLLSFLTEHKAPFHFEDIGRKENRECVFNWQRYLQRNLDLAAVGLVTEMQALEHYVAYGKKEGRVHSTAEERYGCDWRVYLLLNPDVAASVNQAQAAEHYHASGRMEGLECRFNYERYLELNSDLILAGVRTEQQAVTHYLTVGRKENRRHSLESLTGPSTLATCCARSYLLLNPDLHNLVPEADAMKHYEVSGKAEKRECGFDWKQYLENNEDLSAAGILTEKQALDHYVGAGRKEGRASKHPVAKVEGFLWMAYLEANLDLYYLANLKLQVPAIRHFNSNGMNEGRLVSLTPTNDSWAGAVEKLQKHLKSSGAAQGKQNLIIYNIEDIGSSDVAIDITLNNVRTFVTAMLHHAEAEAAGGVAHKAFYLFNVAAITDNPALALLPQLPNVAIVHWTFSSSSLNAFLHTLRMLGASITSAVDAVFHLNSGVRGPLAQYEGGRWISQYRDLLDGEGVGLVGSIIDCLTLSTPYVQPHAFVLRGSLIYSLLQELDKYYSSMVFVPMEDYFRFRLTAMVQEQGQRVASLQHSRQTGLRYFTSCPALDGGSSGSSGNGTGTGGGGSGSDGADALTGVTWCDIDPQVVLFLRWSGESMGAPDFLCGKAVAMNSASRVYVQLLLHALVKIPLSTPLPTYLLPLLPESLTSMIIYEEFGKELALSWPPAPKRVEQKTQVCVAVLVGGARGGGSVGGGVSGGAGRSQGLPLKQASLANTLQCKSLPPAT
ncbi:hypothetical protein B484DRAFT_259982 [Ochromonadaceae sp. CCMP2298]|nr:hypothetical protein B484DRAFT_259982 [Ochromonadaceae sp. CCMP2298]